MQVSKLFWIHTSRFDSVYLFLLLLLHFLLNIINDFYYSKLFNVIPWVALEIGKSGLGVLLGKNSTS